MASNCTLLSWNAHIAKVLAELTNMLWLNHFVLDSKFVHPLEVFLALFGLSERRKMPLRRQLSNSKFLLLGLDTVAVIVIREVEGGGFGATNVVATK